MLSIPYDLYIYNSTHHIPTQKSIKQGPVLKLITPLLSLVVCQWNDFLFEAIRWGTFPRVSWGACAVPGSGERSAPVLGWERRHWRPPTPGGAWNGNGNGWNVESTPAAAKERSDSASSFFLSLLKRALVQVSPEGNSNQKMAAEC